MAVWTESTRRCFVDHDDRGVFGAVENDDERAVQWATDLLAELRSDADPIPA